MTLPHRSFNDRYVLVTWRLTGVSIRLSMCSLPWKLYTMLEGRQYRETFSLLTGKSPCGLSLYYNWYISGIQLGHRKHAPVIPRSRSTFNLSKTCSFFPLCFFWMVPVSYVTGLVLGGASTRIYKPRVAWNTVSFKQTQSRSHLTYLQVLIYHDLS